MATVDLDNEFLDLFYNITNSKVPAEPTLVDLKKQLINVVVSASLFSCPSLSLSLPIL